MAKADDYAKWIVDNQGKKGTPDFDTVVNAYQIAKKEESFDSKDLVSQIPGQEARFAVPPIPKEEMAGEPKYLERAAMYLGGIPITAGLARGAQLASAGTKAAPYAARFAEAVIPKTGKELAKMSGLAAATSVPAEKARSLAEESGAGAGGQALAELTGGLAGGLGTAGVGSVLSKTARKTGELVGRYGVGSTQPQISDLARKWESRGYILEPSQLQKDRPLASPGFMEKAKNINEDLATKEVSAKTGVETSNITPSFIKGRLDDLGKDYNKIFNRNITIDTKLVNDLKTIADIERSVSPVGSGKVYGASMNIVNRWIDEVTKQQLQKIQRQVPKTTPVGPSGKPVSLIRSQKEFPNLRTAGDQNLPDWYASTKNTIDDLSQKLGIAEPPQLYVATPRRGLYGAAHPDGWIVISDKLDSPGAIATALHEFGHQAEFKMFWQADDKVKKEIVRAFETQNKDLPLQKLSVEQYRPITASKYDPTTRGAIPDLQFEKNYLRNFNEWFAEQTSRWITTTKQPTSSVEKFFAKIADTWKAIYQRVVGYVPMVQEVDNFFRSNWKGDLISDALTQSGVLKSESGFPVIPSRDIEAKIPGLELQRLRSAIQTLARESSDGKIRNVAGEYVSKIDDAIGRFDPSLLEQLKETNRRYAATATLADGVSRGFVTQGKVSLKDLGEYLAGKLQGTGYGAGTSTHPLYELGYEGQQLNLVSRAVGESFPKYDATAAILGRGKRALSSIVGGRTQFARDLQRYASEQEAKKAEKK
jgi:hypothetical protein